jgi:FtsP/CotA-like multicopper oxidase with cupredoxin domain
MKRRQFLQLGAGAAVGTFVEHASALTFSAEGINLHISPVSVELAPNLIVHTTGYNGQTPGPVLRVREGIPTTISVTNLTSSAEPVQWYGFTRKGPTIAQESVIRPGTTQTYQLVPTISGTRWYRAPGVSQADSDVTNENGQFGFLVVSSRNEQSAFDQEIFLAIRHWNLPNERPEKNQPINRYASFNNKLLGAGEPVRVRMGERILFRFLNANAREEAILHLPGHRFNVIALDGKPVPRQASVDVLSVAPGERIDAIVEMNCPGKWILGSVDDAERIRGLGVHIEYANQRGAARWSSPPVIDWSYAHFSGQRLSAPEDNHTYEVFLEKRGTRLHWIFEDRSYSNLESLPFPQDSRFRLKMMNMTDQNYCAHVSHRNFVLTRANQIPVDGVIKDTIRLERYNIIEADVIPNKCSYIA